MVNCKRKAKQSKAKYNTIWHETKKKMGNNVYSYQLYINPNIWYNNVTNLNRNVIRCKITKEKKKKTDDRYNNKGHIL